MTITWLVTLLGEDRPDELNQIARTIALAEGVFLDSQQAVLNGKVAALWKVLLPAAHAAYARQTLTLLAGRGLNLSIEELVSDTGSRGPVPRLTLEVSGSFRFGIDHEIRLILESHGACVEQLTQQVAGSPLLGETPFSIRVRARLTRPLAESDLRRVLSRLAPGLQIEIRTESVVSV